MIIRKLNLMISVLYLKFHKFNLSEINDCTKILNYFPYVRNYHPNLIFKILFVENIFLI